VSIIYILISVVLGAIAQVLMKFGASTKSEHLLSMYLNFYTICGLMIYGVSAILWIYALSKVQLSVAYPMVSIGYIIVILLSFLIFKESINLYKIIGLIGIIISVLFISKS
jgi:multidrug transporter EmrE-like cation transporter